MFETGDVMAKNILEQLIRVRQICAAPELLQLKGSSPKIDWIKQYLKDYPDKSVLIFSNSTKFLRLVLCVVGGLKGNAAIIDGAVPLQERQHAVNQFQSKKIQVLLIQTQAGKEGLTLDMADATIFLDTYPPVADYLQARDRMVPTQLDHVKPQEIIHLMMQDTYDEQLYNLVHQGITTTDVINDYINYIQERKKAHG